MTNHSAEEDGFDVDEAAMVASLREQGRHRLADAIEKAIQPRRDLRVYIEPRDWWIGYYRGDTHHYVCPLPTIVVRWKRRIPAGKDANE